MEQKITWICIFVSLAALMAMNVVSFMRINNLENELENAMKRLNVAQKEIQSQR